MFAYGLFLDRKQHMSSYYHSVDYLAIALWPTGRSMKPTYQSGAHESVLQHVSCKIATFLLGFILGSQLLLAIIIPVIIFKIMSDD